MFKNLLFVHDGPIYLNKSDNSFFSVHYNDSLVERYRLLGENVTFLMRVDCIENNQSNLFTKISSNFFKVVQIPNYKSISRLYKKFNAKKIIYDSVSNSDVVIVRLPSSAGLIALNYAQKLNKPVLVEVVACVFDALWNYDWRGKILSSFKLYQYKKAILNSKFVLYVTDNFLQNRYPTKGYTVGCSDVFISEPNDIIIENRVIKINSLPNLLSLTIGSVGALDAPYKSQEDVIKAVSYLNNHGFNITYKIVGQGDPSRLNYYIRKYSASSYIKIIGLLPHSQVNSFLDSIDLFIHPSKVEGLPRAVIEAMSRGCPILGSAAGGTPELIQKGQVFKPGNYNEIIGFINSLTKEQMLKIAIRNFNKSFFYTNTNLSHVRNKFYIQFLNFYNN